MNSRNEASELAKEAVGQVEINLLPQEIPVHDRNSRFRFNPLEKQLVATRAAIDEFGAKVIQDCIDLLWRRADELEGLDYLQVFAIGHAKKKLWFIEDGQVITALLPSDY